MIKSLMKGDIKMKKEKVLSFLLATGALVICSPSTDSVFASSGYGGGNVPSK